MPFSGGSSPAAMVLIASGVLAAPAGNIDITSIPTGYKELYLLLNSRKSTATNGDIYLQFNADTGASYVYGYVQTINTTVTGYTSGVTNQIVCGVLPDSGSATAMCQLRMDITNRSDAYYKGINSQSYELTSNSTVRMCSGQWNNSANEINEIKLTPSNNNFVVGTSWQLWGMK